MRFRLSVVVLLTVLVSTALVAQSERSEFEPLLADSVGSSDPPPPRTVTPPGSYDLSIDGDFNLGGFVFKDGYPFLHNDGGATYRNTALGVDALISTTPGFPDPFLGVRNTAVGHSALEYNTRGFENTAIGASALEYNTTGYWNTATGSRALRSNITGWENTANGAYALESNTDGDRNTAFGVFALHYNTMGYFNTAIGALSLTLNTTGDRNLALGYSAGFSNSTGSDNILIASSGGNQSNTLRIGEGTGTGQFQQDRAFISGIHNATLNGMNEHPVCVDDDDQLGVCSESSARFKSEIAEMGSLSTSLLDLRPVVFQYKPEAKKGPRPMEYGLIAEEVAEVFPHLVRYDDEGKPLTLRYDLLTPLLLNELQKQNRQNQVQWALMGLMFLATVALTVGRWRFG